VQYIGCLGRIIACLNIHRLIICFSRRHALWYISGESCCVQPREKEHTVVVTNSWAVMSTEKGVHLEVTCAGMLSEWRLTITGTGGDTLFCEMHLSLAEVGELMEVLLKTAGVLETRAKADLIGRVCAGLHRLEPSFSYSVERKMPW
jgi:hypothetical protein